MRVLFILNQSSSWLMPNIEEAISEVVLKISFVGANGFNDVEFGAASVRGCLSKVVLLVTAVAVFAASLRGCHSENVGRVTAVALFSCHL